jgi:hypothetical protein
MWQANCVYILQLWNYVNEGMLWFLRVFDLFCCFVTFVKLLGTVYASFIFMDIILLFMLTCRNLLVKSPLYGDVSEKLMMRMFDPFSAGTLTPLERWKRLLRVYLPPYLKDS